MATKFGKIVSNKVVENKSSTPFDLLDISIGGVVVKARPFEMATDSQSGDQVPARVATSCPHCGHGIYADIRQDLYLMGALLTAECANCGAGVVREADPIPDYFRNPVFDGLIHKSDINHLYTNIKSEAAVLSKLSPNLSAADKVASRRRSKTPPEPVPADVVSIPPEAPSVSPEPKEIVGDGDLFDALGGDCDLMGKE